MLIFWVVTLLPQLNKKLTFLCVPQQLCQPSCPMTAASLLFYPEALRIGIIPFPLFLHSKADLPASWEHLPSCSTLKPLGSEPPHSPSSWFLIMTVMRDFHIFLIPCGSLLHLLWTSTLIFPVATRLACALWLWFFLYCILYHYQMILQKHGPEENITYWIHKLFYSLLGSQQQESIHTQ